MDDRFDGRQIPRHWSLYNGPYRSAPENCAEPSQDFVQDGRLVLLMSYRRHGVCGKGWYTGGMQVAHEFGGVDQTVQVRFRVVGTDLSRVRSHRNVPMRWPSHPGYSWYEGEADYCEGSELSGCSTFLHYRNAHTQLRHDYSFDVTDWHTFKVVHRSHRVQVFVDGILSWDFTGNALTVPGVFRRTVLQQECQLAGCPSPSLRGDTERIEIDYVTIDNPD